ARLDQTRMARQQGERRVPVLHVKGAARRLRALLAHDLFARLREDAGELALQERHLRRREQLGDEEVALLFEFGDLRLRELHRDTSRSQSFFGALSDWMAAMRWTGAASACRRAERSAASASPRMTASRIAACSSQIPRHSR